MKYFIACPNCGYELLKAENGSYIEIECHKCSNNIVIAVNDGKLVIQKVLTDKTQDT